MKQSFLALAFLFISLNSHAITKTCEGLNLQGDESSIIINSNSSSLTVNLRCFDTMDIWIDCDTHNGNYKQKEDELFMDAWKVRLNSDQSAQLFYKDELWADLQCF